MSLAVDPSAASLPARASSNLRILTGLSSSLMSRSCCSDGERLHMPQDDRAETNNAKAKPIVFVPRRMRRRHIEKVEGEIAESVG